MKIKRVVKRLFAVGAGVGMLGATAMGALAADLKNYPDMFVKDGVFNGYFVVGEAAASVDNLAMTDIAASMMYHKPVSAGAGKVTVEGDAVPVSKSGDLLELYEDIGQVRETLTGSDLEALKSYTMSTDKGTTPVNQFLRLQTQTTAGSFTRTKSNSGRVTFAEDDNDVTSDFLYFGDGDYVFEYELEFTEGLETDLVSNSLDDLEDESVWIMGKQFTIVDANRVAESGGATDVQLEMMGGAVRDVVSLGTPKSYTIDGAAYNVELAFADTTKCKFVVNGETTDLLTDGDTDRLSDGTEIGVSEVLYQDFAGGIQSCEFFLGADKIELEDTSISDSSFYTSGVKINEENIEDAQVKITGSNTSTTLEITDIKYQLKADGKGGDEAFISAGHGLRESLDEPQGMLHAGWDVTYKGLNEASSETVKFDAGSDDSYTLRFTNVAGTEYNVPFVDNSGNNFVFGDDSDRLWFTEFPSSYNKSSSSLIEKTYNTSYFVIDEDAYVVLSDDPMASADETTYTYVLRFDSLDTSNNEVQFSDIGSGQTYQDTYDAATNATVAAVIADWNNMSSDSITRLGVGAVIVGGKSYAFVVDETTGNLTMDLDQSGTITNTSRSAIVSQNGLVINPLAGNASTGVQSQSYTGVAGSTVVSSGNLLNAAAGNGHTFNVTMSIPSDNLDEATASETTVVLIQKAASNEVDLDVGAEESTLNANISMQSLQDIDEDRTMTTYGLLLVQATDSGSSNNNADELTVTVPKQQAEAQVFIEAGAVSGGVDARGELSGVTVVDATRLDSEVTDVAAQNLIVVGGPCVNTVAAQLVGSPADCTEGFTPGRARVKLFEHANGNMAMLVAGYTGADTRLAGRVIAHRAGELSGMEVEVEGTTYQDARVGAPAPAAAPAAAPVAAGEE